MEALSTVRKLIGLQIVAAAHAADMRGFGFGIFKSDVDQRVAEWWLHILCSWRLESDAKIITGSFDWNEQAVRDSHEAPEWDPANGGSLQEERLRELFQDNDKTRRTLTNKTELLRVEDVSVDKYGGLVMKLTGGLNLHIFPAGSRGEFWRVFKKNDLSSHYVCERRDDY